jgi:serine/threonine protein kinase
MLMPHYPQTLSDLIAVHSNKLSFVTSLHIVGQLIDALHNMHHVGVVHLDIKPQNIFLDEHNNALLGDFDNAVVLQNSPLAARFFSLQIENPTSKQANFSATVDFASPEQKRALTRHERIDNSVDTKSDMYSLGVLWFRILTGKLPDLETGNNDGLHELSHVLDDIAPEWAITLIGELLNHEATNRPCTVTCKSTILKNSKAPEINDTIAVSELSDTASNTTPKQALGNKNTEMVRGRVQWLQKLAFPLIVIILVFSYWGYDAYVNKEAAKFSGSLNRVSQTGLLGSNKHAASVNSIALSDEQKTAVPIDVYHSISPQIPSLKQAENTNVVHTSSSSTKKGTYSVFSETTNNVLEFDWVIIDKLPNVRIMTTEVTNALFAMCADEGACRRSKRFSTGPKETNDEVTNLPKVNIDWYEITEQFIPWLNQKMQKQFVLPNLEQWQLMTHANQVNRNSPSQIHCKNCQHQLSRQYSGATMPVKSIKPNQNGIYHLLGNAQEWLLDCWQQRSSDNALMKRCDQAMVVGGSWLSKRSEIASIPKTQLLKTAKTPTTGFRLVELINE